MLLLAAGCANAGISDWLNPFRVFGGNKQAQGQTGAASSVQHSPRVPGHRGTRQLYSNAPSGAAHAPHGSVPSPQLGSPPGHLDDGFKPSFPPGFANPPSHSPNLNPFATTAGQGSEILGKGPFLPSQLTTYHTPNAPPHTPLVKPAPAPSPGGVGPRPRGRFPFSGGKGRRPQHAVPPHAAVDTGSSMPDGTGPVGPDGAPMAYSEFAGLAGPMSAPAEHPEYEETPTTPPESAPQQRPHRPSLFSRLTGRHHRPAGPPAHLQGGRHPYGRPQQHHGGPPAGGPPSGPPSGGPSGPDGISFLEGNQEQNPFAGNNPLSSLNGNGRPGSDIFYAGSPGSNAPFTPAGPQGPDGPSPFGNPSSGGPSPFGNPSSGGPSPFAGGQPGGPSPYANPQSGGPYGGGPGGPGGYRPGPGGPSSLFGASESGPQGPPAGGPSGANFFAPNGNDYPDQFEGGPRDVRQQNGFPGPQDNRPQPYGPPETAGADHQNPGFYGALHNEGGPQHQNFFNGQESGPGGPGGPPSYDSGSPYGGNPSGVPSGNPGIYGAPAPGSQPGYSPAQRPRKPPVRSFLRNPLSAFGYGSPSTLPSHNANPIAMSASSNKLATLPVPKGSRLLRPFQRKSGGIIPLSSPKDPNYRPMRLGASNLNPITAAYEPDTVNNLPTIYY